MGEDFNEKISKNGKTKAVVWDILRTATKQEKKLRTTEIEIYPSVKSNGLSGIGRIVNNVTMFWDFGSSSRRHVADNMILGVFVSQMAVKIPRWVSKTNFGIRFD